MQGLADLIKRLEAIGEPHPVLRAAQIKTVSEAQKLAPRRTGFLQRAILPGMITASHAQVVVNTPYAAAQELGSGLHGPKHAKYLIKPKNKKALFFSGMGQRGPVLTPPSHGRPTSGRAVRLSGSVISAFRGRSTRRGRVSWKEARDLGAAGGAQLTVVKVVHHPGVKAQPFLIPGAKKAVESLLDVIVTLWNRAA